jgi:hypothetical protein
MDVLAVVRVDLHRNLVADLDTVYPRITTLYPRRAALLTLRRDYPTGMTCRRSRGAD